MRWNPGVDDNGEWDEGIRYGTRRRVRAWWAGFIQPLRVNPGWKSYPDSLRPSQIALVHFSEAHTATVAKMFSTPADLKMRRSWLLPWRRYRYLDVGPEAVYSSYYALYAFPGVGLDQGRKLAEGVIEMIKRTALEREWFSPSTLWGRTARIEPVDRINLVSGIPYTHSVDV